MKRFSLFFFGALALLCLLFRLIWPGEMPFIADEPLFQMMLDDFRAAGEIPLTSFRGSSIPIAYGAGALWIYWLIRSVTDSLEGLIILHILIYSSGAFFLAKALKGKVGGTERLILLWLMLSSPVMFFFSRFAWDSTFFVPMSALLLLLIRRMDERGPGELLPWLALAFIGAYMINIHLMAGPVVLAAGLTAAYLLYRSDLSFGRKTFLIGSGFFLFALALTPYLWEALRLFQQEGVGEKSSSREFWGNGRNLWWLLQRSFIYMGSWRADVFFGPELPAFSSYSILPASFFKLDPFGWVVKLLSLLGIVTLAVTWAKERKPGGMELFCLLAFALTILVFNALNIPMENHYFHSGWWVSFLALALLLPRLKEPVRYVALAFVALGALSNTVFIGSANGFIRENTGMRNMTYGSTMEEMRRLVADACFLEETNEISVNRGEVFVLEHPIRFFMRTLPECRGKALAFQEPAVWTLRYKEAAPSAALTWEWKNSAQ